MTPRTAVPFPLPASPFPLLLRLGPAVIVERPLWSPVMKYTLKVHGKTLSADAPPEMPLLWVLRDLLDLKGTKFGCGVAQCGACTVHLNGSAVRSCQTPIST